MGNSTDIVMLSDLNDYDRSPRYATRRGEEGRHRQIDVLKRKGWLWAYRDAINQNLNRHLTRNSTWGDGAQEMCRIPLLRRDNVSLSNLT